MKIFDVKVDKTIKDDVDEFKFIKVGMAADRWQYKLLGWHFLTIYRQDIHMLNDDDTVTKKGIFLRQWFFSVSNGLSFGLQRDIKKGPKND